jgi:hypothetical protein
MTAPRGITRSACTPRLTIVLFGDDPPTLRTMAWGVTGRQTPDDIGQIAAGAGERPVPSFLGLTCTCDLADANTRIGSGLHTIR